MGTAYSGRDRLISFSVCKPSDGDELLATVAARSFLHIGGTKDKGREAAWDKSEYTNSDSPQFRKEYITTFIDESINISGTYLLDSNANLAALRSAILYPDEVTQASQPFMWLKYEHPDFPDEYLFGLAENFNLTETYNEATTYEFKFNIMKSLQGA